MIKQPKRSIQHKPTRDERKKNQDMQDLRAENRSLRRQMAHMRKEAQKPEVVKYEATVFVEPNLDIEKCSKCESVNIRSWTSPAGTVVKTCVTCGARTTTKKE